MASDLIDFFTSAILEAPLTDNANSFYSAQSLFNSYHLSAIRLLDLLALLLVSKLFPQPLQHPFNSTSYDTSCSGHIIRYEHRRRAGDDGQWSRLPQRQTQRTAGSEDIATSVQTLWPLAGREGLNKDIGLFIGLNTVEGPALVQSLFDGPPYS